MFAGAPYPTGEGNPAHISPLDITKGHNQTRVHEMKLNKGDCVFIPSYWWY